MLYLVDSLLQASQRPPPGAAPEAPSPVSRVFRDSIAAALPRCAAPPDLHRQMPSCHHTHLMNLSAPWPSRRQQAACLPAGRWAAPCKPFLLCRLPSPGPSDCPATVSCEKWCQGCRLPV